MDERTVFLGGLTVCLRGDDLAPCRALFANLAACAPATGPPDVTLTAVDAAPQVPDGPPLEHHGPIRIWRRGEQVFVDWAGVLTASGTHAEFVIGPTGQPGDVARGIRQIVPIALAHLLGSHDRVLLHAGAVLVDAGALLVLGPTGAGKSTVVYAARRAGLGVLADDLVVAMPGDGAVTVAGVPRPLAIATDDASQLPSDARPIGNDVRDRWEFPLDGVGGWHPVRGVVLIEHGRRPEGHLEPAPPMTVWDAVVGSFVAVTEPARFRRAFPLLAALSREGGWRLGLGDDPATRLDVTARQLDQIARDPSTPVPQPHEHTD